MRTFNMNWKRMYVLLVCSLLLFGLQAGVGIATPDDASSITHTFKNTHATNNYSDLHIEYTKNVRTASNPIITGAGGANVTSWSKSSSLTKMLSIDGSFPPGSSVNVEAFSKYSGLKVKQYWWTLGGDIVGTKIPVYYVYGKAGENGNFSKTYRVNKPNDTVKETITGTINIAGGTGGITVTKKAYSSTKTDVTFVGTLEDSGKKGRVSAIVDPPEETFDLVIDIFPTTAVPGLNTMGLLALFGLLMTISVIAIRKRG